jgi:hypothetical protein
MVRDELGGFQSLVYIGSKDHCIWLSILPLLSLIGPNIFLRSQYVFFLKSKRPDLISYNRTIG